MPVWALLLRAGADLRAACVRAGVSHPRRAPGVGAAIGRRARIAFNTWADAVANRSSLLLRIRSAIRGVAPAGRSLAWLGQPLLAQLCPTGTRVRALVGLSWAWLGLPRLVQLRRGR